MKAAGGCAAPAAKDPEVAAREMGQMKLRQFDDAKGGPAGPARGAADDPPPQQFRAAEGPGDAALHPGQFITDLEVDQGGKTLFSMTGGISISEDPSFRFDYTGDATAPFHAKATDTEGNVFEKTFGPGQS